MPRQPRKPSGTGIYHIMMRGINHQNIYYGEEDYYQFINTLDRMRVRYDDDGQPCGFIPYDDLETIVNELLPEEFISLDDDNEKPKFRLSDDQVWKHIISLTKVTTSTEFQYLEIENGVKKKGK